jgi:hypothetical protein
MKRLILWAGVVLLLVGTLNCGSRYVVVSSPPPPPKAEVRPPIPHPKAVWIPGHWEWKKGKYVWVPGHWVKEPPPGAVWTPGYWKKTRRGYIWVPGHWKR